MRKFIQTLFKKKKKEMRKFRKRKNEIEKGIKDFFQKVALNS